VTRAELFCLITFCLHSPANAQTMDQQAGAGEDAVGGLQQGSDAAPLECVLLLDLRVASCTEKLSNGHSFWPGEMRYISHSKCFNRQILHERSDSVMKLKWLIGLS